MAIYEYDCMSCAQRYTKERSINEDDPGYLCCSPAKEDSGRAHHFQSPGREIFPSRSPATV